VILKEWKMKHNFFKYNTKSARKVFFLLSISLLFAFSSLFVYAQGTVWEEVSYNRRENIEFLGATSNDNLFVAIGKQSDLGVLGLNYTSPDGLKWTARTLPVICSDVTFGNGMFVAAGIKGKMLTSTNGINWSSINCGVAAHFNEVVYAPDKGANGWFVAIADTGQIAVSTDGGATYTVHVDPSIIANGITYGNGLFVLAGNKGVIYYSTDAVNWTSKKVGDRHLVRADYGNNTFVAVGYMDIFSSTNGIDWTKRVTDPTAFFQDVTYTNFTSGATNMFVAVAVLQQMVVPPIYTSPDGVSWTKRNSHARTHLMAVACKGNSQRVVGFGVLSNIIQSDNIAPTITVTNPAHLGGLDQVILASGSTTDITWTVTGTVGNITLEFSSAAAGGSYTTIVDSVPAANGKYTWTVPNINSERCVIRASETDGEPLIHSAPFTITNGSTQTITFKAPNGGEKLVPGTKYLIKWTGSITFDKIDIEYYNGSQWVVIVNGTEDDGSYNWTVPDVSTSQARLWMKGWSSLGNATDYTDGTFTIGEVPEINITAPNGGEILTGGTSYTIRWQSSITFDKIDIEYYNGSKWVVIINGAADVGTYSWTVPNISTNAARLWIKGWSSSGNPVDFTDNNFSIIPPPAGAITVTSPNGGEVWAKGSTENITWTSSGEVGNVKISYSTDNGFNWTDIVSSTANDGSYAWKLPDILADDCLVKVRDVNNSQISDISNGVFSIGGPPQIVLNRNRFNFGYIKNGASPCVQTLFIYNGGGGTLNWTAEADASWINLNPTSGTGGGSVAIAINTVGLNTGSFIGTITVGDPNVGNSPQTAQVYLTVKNGNQDAVPFGTFATPEDGLANVSGSIAVTGWALDDTCVENVKVYRQVNGELSFIGDAVFVDGARPDVEQAYPDYPNNYRSGWGYMMLTNFLPDGQLVLKAIATDNTGHQVELGTKTITVDNANAVDPFGAIDTPTQGGEASGTKYRNNGWALTPQPNKIPIDGSTINVFIDGVPVDNVHYNLYRSDIANLFPTYANANGAWGYLDFDTTACANGVHTIAWSATDNAGNTDGIGSRYFSIQNTGGAPKSSAAPYSMGRSLLPLPAEPMQSPNIISHIPVDHSLDRPIWFKTGYDDITPRGIYPDYNGIIHLKIKELERINIHLDRYQIGYMVVNGEPRLLPVGSTMNPKTGVFSWQPGPGFLGEYEFVFFGRNLSGKIVKRDVFITIEPGI
jgi:hypothetical protein